MTQLLPPKKEVALALLERSNVDVYLDPRARGVVVPPQFRKEPRLILKIGLNMPVPIPDLRLDEESMSCTLSFNRSPFYCVVPWSSVFAMVGEDGRGMVWPDDVPQELAVKVVEPGAEGEEQPTNTGPSLVPSPPPSGSAGSGSNAPTAPNVTGKRAARASKLADENGGETRRSQKKKKPSDATAGANANATKKEESTRPTLVAVPSLPASRPSSPSPSAPSSSAPTRSEEEARTERRSRPAPTPPAPSRPSSPTSPVNPAKRAPQAPPQASGSGRPKRELPPYLRVVK